MKHQPLWIDISHHQGLFDFSAAAEKTGDNKVWGCFSRTGWGEYGGRIDQQFERNWPGSRVFDYRSSYWAYWPYYPHQHQLDLWFTNCPEIDVIPRMIDMEVGNAPDPFIADCMWDMSEQILARDGYRPIIYSRTALIEKWLATWTSEQLNAHYYLLAQYDLNDKDDPSTWGEYNGIVIPDRINADRVLWKQTTSLLPLHQGSGNVDRDRWIWTDAETMHEQIEQMWGGAAPPPADCCEELDARLIKVENRIPLIFNHIEDVEEDLVPRVEDLEEEWTDTQKNVVDIALQLSALENKVAGLEGGHDHPDWMYKLGLVKK